MTATETGALREVIAKALADYVYGDVDANDAVDRALAGIAEAGPAPAGGNVPKNPCPCCGRCLDAEPDAHRRCQVECEAVLIGLDGAEAEAYVTQALAGNMVVGTVTVPPDVRAAVERMVDGTDTGDDRNVVRRWLGR